MIKLLLRALVFFLEIVSLKAYWRILPPRTSSWPASAKLYFRFFFFFQPNLSETQKRTLNATF